MQYHAIPCNIMQHHAIPCNTMQYHAIPCNTMQHNSIPCNTMQYHASLITADGVYHCPVGSTWPFFSQQQAAWILFLVLSVHKNIISYQKTVACTFVQVTAGSQAKIDLAIKLGADKGVIVIIIINTFTFSSSLLPPTPSSTAVLSYKGLPFILLVKFHQTKSQSGN